MSVAFELDQHTVYPRLEVVRDRPVPATATARGRRRSLALLLVAVGLLVVLLLPIRALAGISEVGSAPTPGQEYIVKSGDSLVSIARQVAPGAVGPTAQRLVAETGSETIVPGEHLLIP